MFIKELYLKNLGNSTELCSKMASCTNNFSSRANIRFTLQDFVRYFNVIGSDPEGRLGEAPRPELREQGRISGACFDAAKGIIPGLKVLVFLYVQLLVG